MQVIACYFRNALSDVSIDGPLHISWRTLDSRRYLLIMGSVCSQFAFYWRFSVQGFRRVILTAAHRRPTVNINCCTCIILEETINSLCHDEQCQLVILIRYYFLKRRAQLA